MFRMQATFVTTSLRYGQVIIYLGRKFAFCGLIYLCMRRILAMFAREVFPPFPASDVTISIEEDIEDFDALSCTKWQAGPLVTCVGGAGAGTIPASKLHAS